MRKKKNSAPCIPKTQNSIPNELLILDSRFKAIEEVYPNQASHFFNIQLFRSFQQSELNDLQQFEASKRASEEFERDLKEFFANCTLNIINRAAKEPATLTGVTVFTWNDFEMLRLITKGFKIHAGSIRGGKSRAEFSRDAQMIKRRIYLSQCLQVRQDNPTWSKSKVYSVTSKRLAKKGLHVSPRSLRRYVKIDFRRVQ